MSSGTRCAILITVAGAALFAQDSEQSQSGFTWYESFQGSVSSLGIVSRLDNNVGYNFSSRFSVDAGLPVYLVRPSTSVVAAIQTRSAVGIGNAYARVHFALSGDAVNFVSTLTGTAPTGNKDNGFSTGHATVDWSNYFDRDFSRLTPFGEIGFANSVSDTLFFVRPYETQGFVTHLQGGARYRIANAVSVGASAYAIEPSGQQTVVSRLMGKSGQTGAASGASMMSAAGANSSNRRGGKQGVFETVGSTTGSAEIARDHGYSAWCRFSTASGVDFSVGYTRSAEYALNTLFFGVGMRLDQVFRRR